MKDIRNKILGSVDKLFERKQFKSLKELLITMEPADIAEILSEKNFTERVFIFRLLPKDLAIEVFEFLEGTIREELLASFTDSEAASIIEDMSDDDRTALFDELPAKTVKKLLARLSPEERRLANTLLNYPPDSAGHIMTPEFVDLKEDMSSSEALARIRQSAAKKETIYTLFVVDPARKLMGTVHLEDLILASVDVAVKDLMDALPVFVSTDTDQEEAAKTMSKYDLQTIPVVDREHRLVGILTFDDILDIVQDEATEDFERMAGISPVDERYMEAGVFTLTRKRFTWLLVCIVTQVFSSSILENYSFALESVVALAFFIPLLIDERGEPRISFPDGSVLLYNGEKVTCIAEGASPGESDAEKWLNSQ
jgi:magnesium transporter